MKWNGIYKLDKITLIKAERSSNLDIELVCTMTIHYGYTDKKTGVVYCYDFSEIEDHFFNPLSRPAEKRLSIIRKLSSYIHNKLNMIFSFIHRV